MMKGRINKKGFLFIARANRYKQQFCPMNDEGMPCCDDCPIFGDPYTERGVTTLAICQGRTLVFDEFEDERI